MKERREALVVKREGLYEIRFTNPDSRIFIADADVIAGLVWTVAAVLIAAVAPFQEVMPGENLGFGKGVQVRGFFSGAGFQMSFYDLLLAF